MREMTTKHPIVSINADDKVKVTALRSFINSPMVLEEAIRGIDVDVWVNNGAVIYRVNGDIISPRFIPKSYPYGSLGVYLESRRKLFRSTLSGRYLQGVWTEFAAGATYSSLPSWFIGTDLWETGENSTPVVRFSPMVRDTFLGIMEIDPAPEYSTKYQFSVKRLSAGIPVQKSIFGAGWLDGSSVPYGVVLKKTRHIYTPQTLMIQLHDEDPLTPQNPVKNSLIKFSDTVHPVLSLVPSIAVKKGQTKFIDPEK